MIVCHSVQFAIQPKNDLERWYIAILEEMAYDEASEGCCCVRRCSSQRANDAGLSVDFLPNAVQLAITIRDMLRDGLKRFLRCQR